jgi:hypothetical protein
LEVENRSATPYSSKRTREGSEKLKTIFPFSLQLIWTLTRTKEEWTRQPITEMITMDTCKVLIPLSAGNNEEGDNLSFAFLGQI